MIKGVFHLSKACSVPLLTAAVLCSFTPLPVQAQGITIHTVSAPINILSLSDVDFTLSSNPQWLFSVDVTATGGKTVAVYADITLKVALATGESWEDENGAVRVKTRIFSVTGTRSFTNLDLGKGKPIVDSSTTWNSGAKRKFLDVALPSGQLPAGRYVFDIRVFETFPEVSSDGSSFTFLLTNPTSVSLLFPNDADRNVSQLPLFQWTFDGSRSKISIFELLPGQSSLEEAVQGVALLTQQTGSTSFQYPAAGVRSLQGGHTYVWYVEGEVLALGGKGTVLKSPLRSFTVDAGPSAASSLLDELELVLDPKYKSIFDQIRTDRLTPTGTVRVNGAAIQINELLEILKYLRSHPDAVQSAGLQ